MEIAVTLFLIGIVLMITSIIGTINLITKSLSRIEEHLNELNREKIIK